MTFVADQYESLELPISSFGTIYLARRFLETWCDYRGTVIRLSSRIHGMVCVLGYSEVEIQELTAGISDEGYMSLGDTVAGWCVSSGGSDHSERYGCVLGLDVSDQVDRGWLLILPWREAKHEV